MEGLPKARKSNEAPLTKAVLAVIGGILAAQPADAQVRAQPRFSSAYGSAEKIPNTPQAVEVRLLQLQSALIKGGEYYRDLHSDGLTRERFAYIVNEISSVAGLLAKVRTGAIPLNENLWKYLRTERFPGQRLYPLTYKDGSKGQCNGAYIAEGGETYFVTAQHCVADTKDEDSFFFLSGIAGPDVAIREIPRNQAPQDALTLDRRITDEMLNGQVVLMDTIDRYGKRVQFHSFYVAVTKPMARLFNNEKTSQTDKRAIEGSFWYVAPPEQGMSSDGRGPNYKGESGNLNVVFLPERGGYVIGGVFHRGSAQYITCANDSLKSCTTLEFSDTPQTVVNIIDAYRAMRDSMAQPEPEGWPARITKRK